MTSPKKVDHSEVNLVHGLREVLMHSCETAVGADAWRITMQFINNESKIIPFGFKNEHTEYYVWVSAEYLGDHTEFQASEAGAKKFALDYIIERFEETRDEKGDRDITKISENSTIRFNSKSTRGNDLSKYFESEQDN